MITIILSRLNMRFIMMGHLVADQSTDYTQFSKEKQHNCFNGKYGTVLVVITAKIIQ